MSSKLETTCRARSRQKTLHSEVRLTNWLQSTHIKLSTFFHASLAYYKLPWHNIPQNHVLLPSTG